MVLVVSFFPGCANTNSGQMLSSDESNESAEADEALVTDSGLSFAGLNDPDCLQYVQDSIYSKFDAALQSEDYRVEEVRVSFISKEYLDELAYNSLPNIYFGYTLSELEEQFGDRPYVFLPGEDGGTTVTEYAEYDDTFDQVIRNVAIGGGVILVCVVLTSATGGLGAPAALQTVLALSTKGAITGALSLGALDGAISGIVTGLETGSLEEALKSSIVSASEGFKWGAVVGTVAGGGKGLLSQVKNARVARSWRESEIAVKELYGGEEQVAFLGGKEVARTTVGSTRPDVVASIDGTMTAIEVKNYDLVTNYSGLKTSLQRELEQRVTDLPSGFAQRVVVDVKGKGYSKAFIDGRMRDLESFVKEIDPTIVVEVLR